MVSGSPPDTSPRSVTGSDSGDRDSATGRPVAALEAMQASTQALLSTVDTLSDEQVRAPSLLPGWSRGHVLTHLARSADAMLNLVASARTGREHPMYPSREQRDADIEAGAGRSARELAADLRAAHGRLVAALEELDDQEWSAPIRWGPMRREGRAAMIPVLRRTEVEVHHVDLDLDYTLAHLPEDFVGVMLAEVSEEFGARPGSPGFVLVSTDSRRWTVGAGGPEISGPAPSLLGWLLGRTDGTGLHSEQGLPNLERWR